LTSLKASASDAIEVITPRQESRLSLSENGEHQAGKDSPIPDEVSGDEAVKAIKYAGLGAGPAMPTIAGGIGLDGGALTGVAEPAQKESAPTPKQLTLPLKEGTLYLEAFNELEYDRANRKVRLSGSALMVLADIQVEAELIEIDDIAKNAYLKGKIALQQQDDVIYADEGYLSYESGQFELINVSGNTSGPDIQGAIYFTARDARGNFRDFEMNKVWLTTCPPYCKVYEYEITAKKARVIRDKVVHLYRAYFYVRGKKVMFLPQFSLPIRKYEPLRTTESPIEQNYGYNQTEGFFGKFAYTYDTRYLSEVSPALLGVLKLDLTQKQGPGIGIRQDFHSPLGVTTLKTYYQRQARGEKDPASGEIRKPSRNYQLGLDQELNFSKNFTGTLSVDRQNRYQIFRTRTNTFNSSLNLNYTTPKFTTNITGNQNINITGGFTSTGGNEVPLSKDITGSLNLNHSFQISPKINLNITEGVQTRKRNDGNPADQEGSFATNLRINRPDYGLTLVYEEQAIDLDGDKFKGDDRYSVRSRKPGLELTFPRSTFGKNSFIDRLAINIDNITDKLRNEKEKEPVIRMKLDTNLSKQLSDAPARLSTSLGFTQYMYDDGNAQYIMRPGVRFDYNKGDWFKFNFSWDRTVQHGVKNPPVRGEAVRSRGDSTFGMDFIGAPIFRLSLRSSYNFFEDRWGSLNITADYDPTDFWGVTLTTGYNIENQTWQSLSSRWEFTSPSGNWFLRANMTTKLQGAITTERLDYTYSRRYKRGWNFYVYATQSKQSKGPFFDRVQIQKRNTCTTLNFGFIGDRKEYYFSVFINAFPRYPVEAWAKDLEPGGWDFWINTPTGDIFGGRRGLTGLLTGISGYSYSPAF